MPNRIIKESICYSEDLDQLSPFAETVFYRLLVRVDDYGRIDARPSFLRSMLFATKKGITDKNIDEAVAQLASVGLVQVYVVAGKSFLLFPKWSLHQRVRDSKEKYPPPLEGEISDNLRQLAASRGELRPVSRSRSVNTILCKSSADELHERVKIRDVFEQTYGAYPKKKGKAEGAKAYLAYLTTGRELKGTGRVKLNHQQIYVAVQEYAEQCADKDPQYIQLFSTFMNATVVDLVEETQADYKRVMLGKYGEGWENIRFEYEK